MEGRVLKSTGSWYIVQTKDEILNCRLRGKIRLTTTKRSNPVAVGDQVLIELEPGQKGQGVIQEVIERRNYVIRRSPQKNRHAHIIASNIDLAIVVASWKMPRTSLGFIDRFTVACESYRIPVMVLFNKADLLDQSELEELNFQLSIYRDLGYQTNVISSFVEADTENLKKQLKGKVALFSGHSGVGKSTLLNLIAGRNLQKTSEISTFVNKGKHTTTFAEMFAVGNETFIVDTPGIREFGLFEIDDQELSHYFPEMRSYLNKCKYNDCKHHIEPKCEIRAAVKAGIIAESRYESYLKLLFNE